MLALKGHTLAFSTFSRTITNSAQRSSVNSNSSVTFERCFCHFQILDLKSGHCFFLQVQLIVFLRFPNTLGFFTHLPVLLPFFECIFHVRLNISVLRFIFSKLHASTPWRRLGHSVQRFSSSFCPFDWLF